jgi:hypothetical protein
MLTGRPLSWLCGHRGEENCGRFANFLIHSETVQIQHFFPNNLCFLTSHCSAQNSGRYVTLVPDLDQILKPLTYDFRPTTEIENGTTRLSVMPKIHAKAIPTRPRYDLLAQAAFYVEVVSKLRLDRKANRAAFLGRRCVVLH